MSNSVRPQRRQSTRLPHPWDSPGKNTGVGCHFLLQCMKVKSESEVAQVVYLKVTQLCPTPSDPMDCSLPGSSVHEIFQARVLEWGAIAFSLSQFKNGFKFPKWKQTTHLCTWRSYETYKGAVDNLLMHYSRKDTTSLVISMQQIHFWKIFRTIKWLRITDAVFYFL